MKNKYRKVWYQIYLDDIPDGTRIKRKIIEDGYAVKIRQKLGGYTLHEPSLRFRNLRKMQAALEQCPKGTIAQRVVTTKRGSFINREYSTIPFK